MKYFVFAFVIIAAAFADVSELPSNEYLPPVQEAPAPIAISAPAPVVEAEPAHELASDGYRYKTVKRYRYRIRRDVNELSNEYLPPVQDTPAPAPVEIAAPVVEAEPAHELASDGYRYKTVKRYRYRIRRDVNELPSNEYLPPVQEAPVEISAPVVEAEPAHELANDGYRYKTVKRYRYRHRRDVNELPSNEYLPPTQDAPAPIEIAAPAPVEAEPAHELASDGYRYKTVKRYRYRIRRDVNELPSNEYLPPVQEAPVEISAPVVEAEPAHELANDGYRYKTVKRYRYRHRRDVNELPSNEYLPPTQNAPAPIEIAAPAPVEAEPAHELASDGYRYKTVKRYRYRIRRDVNELSTEYLPPVQDAPAPAPVEIAAPVVEAEPAHELASDGYRYKTVKRYRYRIRRDVNELPSNEYLPPVQEAPVEIAAPVVEAEPAHELANDGYRYKTVKRYRYRHRRDVNELPSNEYLPPVQEAPVEIAAPVVEAEPAHELANDGYRYKTVKRYRFRHRRDVNELPSNEYLPPVQEAPVEISAPVVEAEPAHELANDGYRYKTVKRYRFRHRRDVNELPSNEYLPPVQDVPAPAPIAISAPAPVVEAEPAHELTSDGYRYKTLKRYRYRYRH